MLRRSGRTRLLAGASAFAAAYAVLGLVPVSRLVGIGAFITFREAVSPLAGMVLGPATGGLSVVIGTFIDFATAKPPVFLGLDFFIDLSAAATAGLAFSGRRVPALLVPSAAVALLLAGPASPAGVSVAGVPFVWMHLLSIGFLASALLLEARGLLARVSWPFVGAVALASTMCGHAVGGVLTEWVYLGPGHLFGSVSVSAYWTAIFYLYPEERAFLAVVGTLVAYPVLRALSARERGPRDSG